MGCHHLSPSATRGSSLAIPKGKPFTGQDQLGDGLTVAGDDN